VIDLGLEWMAVAREFPGLIHRAGPHRGYPLSWTVYLLALREMERHEARAKLNAFYAGRMAQAASVELVREWESELDRLAQW